MKPDVVQTPPDLGNQYVTDRVLKGYLRRALPHSVHRGIEEELNELGELSGGRLYDLQQSDLRKEPVLTRWSPWGDRIDRIDVTRVWQEAEVVAADRGIVATAYEQEHGPHSRVHQMALAYLFIPSTDMYGCPLAMTDGAARTLLDVGTDALVEEAVPHLTSRNPADFWTSGQWMTELAGGSDVSNTHTTARQTNETWRLYGRKWFTSAITANMALALARPEGNTDGSEGLALFYVPIRSGEGLNDGITVNRLKDKLGTRKLPTAELQLEGARAVPVTEKLRHGTRHIAPMLTITRTWNAITAAAYVRRGLALARDYAHKRRAFGKPLIDHPLHQEVLADLEATLEGMVHLSFRLAELLGRREAGKAEESEHTLFRLLTRIAKLTTAKQAVAATSEVIEAFGGAGYIEDTGLPPLLRDAQVLPIWEGTTNVLALDLLRTLRTSNGLSLIQSEFKRCMRTLEAPGLLDVVRPAVHALKAAGQWLETTGSEKTSHAGARRFALTLGHALELLYTAHHAQWSLNTLDDGRSAAAADRLSKRPLNHLTDSDRSSAEALARDQRTDPSPWTDGTAAGGQSLTSLIDEIG